MMVESPRHFKLLFERTAAANGISLIRDEPVELKCTSDDYPDATFLIW